MSIKISQLDEQAAPVADAVLPIVQSGTTFKATIAAIVGVFLPTTLVAGDLGKVPYVNASGSYSVTAAPSAAGQVQRWTGAVWEPGAVDLANANAVTGTLPASKGGLGLTVAGGDVNKMLYVSAADTYALTSTVKTNGTYLAFGADPAQSGAARFSIGAGEGIVFRSNAASDIIGMRLSGQTLFISEGTSVGLTVNLASNNFSIQHAGVNSMLVASASLSLPFGGTTATSGSVRVASGFTLQGRDAGNTANGVLLQWNADDSLRFGGDSTFTGMHFRVGSGSHRFFSAGAEVINVSSTVADFKTLELRFGTSPATGAKINVPNNVSIVEARNAGNSSDIILLSTNTSDHVLLGANTVNGGIRYLATSGTTHEFQVAGVAECVIDASRLNLASGNVLQFATTEVAGLINHGHNVTVISGRNTGGTANVPVVQWGGPGDHILFGDATVAGVDTLMDAAGIAEWRHEGALTMSLSGTVLQLPSTVLQFTPATAAIGLIRTGHGVTFWGGLDSAGSASVSLARWGTTSDTLIFGQDTIAVMQLRAASTGVEIYTGASRRVLINDDRLQVPSSVIIRAESGANLQFNVNTSQSHVFRVNAVDKATLDAEVLLLGTSVDIGFFSTYDTPIIYHDVSSAATDTTARTLTVQGQIKSGNTSTIAGALALLGGDATGAGGTHVGGSVTLRGGDAGGASGTRTGGNLDIRAGTGATANGVLTLLNGATKRIEINGTGMGFFAATPVAQPTDIVAFTDNTAGTPGNTLAALPSLTDSPASADALRDDLMTNWAPLLRNWAASFATKHNDMRTRQRNLGLMA